eukprot:TRINITY_DN8905_c0_g1_i2.p1 TRINITY_DN8905_c0_g1~~TRINITY_DN8905_c0_g1_i2.p1  ORF type:complete len:323 (-),score=38.72 TRINITY_DN8905_c0_g1_i2:142-1110(-)
MRIQLGIAIGILSSYLVYLIVPWYIILFGLLGLSLFVFDQTRSKPLVYVEKIPRSKMYSLFLRDLLLIIFKDRFSKNYDLKPVEIEYAIPSDYIRHYKEITSIKMEKNLLSAIETHLFECSMLTLLQPDQPLSVIGSVHTRSIITLHDVAIFKKGNIFEHKTNITNLLSVKKGTVCEITGVSCDQSGKIVFTDVCYILSFHKQKDKENLDYVHPIFEEYPGDLISTTTLEIPKNAGWKFASLSGDYNPIHISNIGAKLFGHKRSIVHGMYVVGRCISILENTLNCELVRLIDVRFRRPLFNGSIANVCLNNLWVLKFIGVFI